MTGSSPLTRGKLESEQTKTAADGLIPAHAGKTDQVCDCGGGVGAHPRSRGENLEDARTDHLHDGSSPLTRGKLPGIGARVEERRLIPAHAGKTRGKTKAVVRTGAHPRSRGENGSGLTPPSSSLGSSPLTRGKLCRRTTHPPLRGLIPAHAGKTSTSETSDQRSAAHPRSRGENMISTKGTAKSEGSSPLTRGKPGIQRSAPEPRRLIPAHAGKTHGARCVRPGRRAHPRSRGENSATDRSPIVKAGSSPLTRGKPHTGRRLKQRAGLIPAHAGKTTPQALRPPARRAHPRSRGENASSPPAAEMTSGSSPLTRGKLSPRPPSLGRQGLIPAHAGKTWLHCFVRPGGWAHPRSRGENQRLSASPVTPWGSSPLTRGKRPQRHGEDFGAGLIPAHAGKTRAKTRHIAGCQAHPRSRGENIR